MSYRTCREFTHAIHRRTPQRMGLIGAVLLIAAIGNASASGVAQIVHARRDHFHTLGRTYKSLRDQTSRSHPNWRIVATDANQLVRLAAALPSWFPAGSGKGHGVSTKARAAIWAKPRAFARAAQRLLNHTQQIKRDADGRDRHALALDTRALGRACGSCHRSFRAHSSWW